MIDSNISNWLISHFRFDFLPLSFFEGTAERFRVLWKRELTSYLSIELSAADRLTSPHENRTTRPRVIRMTTIAQKAVLVMG